MFICFSFLGGRDVNLTNKLNLWNTKTKGKNTFCQKILLKKIEFSEKSRKQKCNFLTVCHNFGIFTTAFFSFLFNFFTFSIISVQLFTGYFNSIERYKEKISDANDILLVKFFFLEKWGFSERYTNYIHSLSSPTLRLA